MEARAGILDETVKDGEGSELAMNVAVLELLANGAGSFGGTGSLQLDDLDEVGDAAQVIFLVRLTGERLDVYGDSRVRLLLQRVSALTHRLYL